MGLLGYVRGAAVGLLLAAPGVVGVAYGQAATPAPTGPGNASLDTLLSSAPAGNLEELLGKVRNADARDAALNKQREAEFTAARDQQGAMLAKAKAEKDALDAQSTAMQKQFEENDKAIAQLKQERDAKAGNLGELFGVMSQTAGDFASAARNSMLSVQFPDRIALLDRLAQTKTMPPIEDLNRFWFEMQQEMTESGKAERFKATVVQPNGDGAEQDVVRVGPFVAISNGQFLSYDTGSKNFSVPPQQPPRSYRSTAAAYEAATTGYHQMVIDPSSGVLVQLFSERPTVLDRINQGGSVAYVILAVGFIGAVFALYQFVYLTVTSRKVKRQLANMSQLRADNPLGRVMLAFKGQEVPDVEDAEVVELRISEAVLKELPAIQRIQPFLKLVVASGPLLGLVGTVVGMIETFQVITESGSGDPKLMAAGIGRAMIATVLGLSIAIPTLFVNAALASRSRKLIHILDEQSTGLLAETLEAREARAAGVKRQHA
jgi:biopolymer transport protein ExbB